MLKLKFINLWGWELHPSYYDHTPENDCNIYSLLINQNNNKVVIIL